MDQHTDPPGSETPPTGSDPPYSLERLAALAELSVRTVRYYIQIGLLDAPTGTGRGSHYNGRHLEQLLQIRKWQLAGLSLERIGELLRNTSDAPLPPAPRRPGSVEVWSHLVVDEGVELVLEPGRAGLSPEQVRALFREITRVYQQIKESQ